MPGTRRRFRPERARNRLERFLQTKCFVCLDSPSEYPSKRLPCCSRFAHEECILNCLQYALGAMREKCPHCRSNLTLYNGSEDIPPGPNPYCFTRQQYPPPPAPPSHDWLNDLDYYGIPPDALEERFLNPPIPPPPPGWAESRRQLRHSTHN